MTEPKPPKAATKPWSVLLIVAVTLCALVFGVRSFFLARARAHIDRTRMESMDSACLTAGHPLYAWHYRGGNPDQHDAVAEADECVPLGRHANASAIYCCWAK